MTLELRHKVGGHLVDEEDDADQGQVSQERGRQLRGSRRRDLLGRRW